MKYDDFYALSRRIGCVILYNVLNGGEKLAFHVGELGTSCEAAYACSIHKI